MTASGFIVGRIVRRTKAGFKKMVARPDRVHDDGAMRKRKHQSAPPSRPQGVPRVAPRGRRCYDTSQSQLIVRRENPA
jgi:hypothetical protein